MALTARAIDSLQSGKLTDPTRIGLSIEVAGRKKAWRYTRRIAGSGSLVRKSLGTWPAYDIAVARRWADDLDREVLAGVDPRVTERIAKAGEMTVAESLALSEPGATIAIVTASAGAGEFWLLPAGRDHLGTTPTKF